MSRILWRENERVRASFRTNSWSFRTISLYQYIFILVSLDHYASKNSLSSFLLLTFEKFLSCSNLYAFLHMWYIRKLLSSFCCIKLLSDVLKTYLPYIFHFVIIAFYETFGCNECMLIYRADWEELWRSATLPWRTSL